MDVSNLDIKTRVERILSDILSDKHEANITIKFTKSKEQNDGNNDTTGIIGEEQVLDRKA